MTPKEKAFQLVKRYLKITDSRQYPDKNGRNAKQCSLIAVDEIIQANPIAFDKDENCIAKQWWQEVKTEIEKL